MAKTTECIAHLVINDDGTVRFMEALEDIVRCKDCKYCIDENGSFLLCGRQGRMTAATGYCNHGIKGEKQCTIERQ